MVNIGNIRRLLNDMESTKHDKDAPDWLKERIDSWIETIESKISVRYE